MNVSTYAQRQIARDREHEAQLRKHYESLSDEDKLKWRDMGLDDIPHDFHSERGVDISEREDLEEIRELASPVAIKDEQGIIALRFIFAELLGTKNKALYIECLAAATGIIFESDSEAEIARRHGVTRAAVSKIVIQICRLLCLAPRGPMRKLTLRRVYAQRAAEVHIANDCCQVG